MSDIYRSIPGDRDLTAFEQAASSRGIPREIWRIDEAAHNKGWLKLYVNQKLRIDCLLTRPWLPDPQIVAEIICKTIITGAGLAYSPEMDEIIEVSAECNDYRRPWLVGVHDRVLVAERFGKGGGLKRRIKVDPVWNANSEAGNDGN